MEWNGMERRWRTSASEGLEWNGTVTKSVLMITREDLFPPLLPRSERSSVTDTPPPHDLSSAGETDLRHKLRAFFLHSKFMLKEEKYTSLVDRMSPSLEAECYSKKTIWLNQIEYLRDAPQAFVIRLCANLGNRLYVPQEVGRPSAPRAAGSHPPFSWRVVELERSNAVQGPRRQEVVATHLVVWRIGSANATRRDGMERNATCRGRRSSTSTSTSSSCCAASARARARSRRRASAGARTSSSPPRRSRTSGPASRSRTSTDRHARPRRR